MPSLPQIYGSVLSPHPLSLHVHSVLFGQTGGEAETGRHMDRELYFGLQIFLYINKENQNTPKMISPASYFPV